MSSFKGEGQDPDPLVVLEEKIREVEDEKKEVVKNIKAFENNIIVKDKVSKLCYIEDKKRLTILENRLAGLEAERRQRLEAQASSRKKDSGVSSGIITPRSQPRSGLHTPNVYKSSGERSVGYYFYQLKSHFKAKNKAERWIITCTRYLCVIYDGKKEQYRVEFEGPSDSAAVRNLYLMLHSCNYDVEDFLKKFGEGEFENFNGCGSDGNRLSTPPVHNIRENVFVLDK
jgi:hypothetical protein